MRSRDPLADAFDRLEAERRAISPRFYSAAEVCRATGVSYRQLDYWDRTGLACPTIAPRGSGTQRRYSAADVARVHMVRLLLDVGISLQRIRRVLDVPDGLDEVSRGLGRAREIAELIGA